MNMKRALLNSAVLSALGVSCLPHEAQAVSLPDGDYIIRINVTPTTVFMGSTLNLVGSDGAWNSSFTFGGPAPGAGSQGMKDDGGCSVGSDTICRGSSIASDGLAGVIGISVANNIVAVTSFSKDQIDGTAGGDFVQYYGSGIDPIPNSITPVNSTGPCGAVVDATSTLALKFTNRLGAITNPNTFFNNAWNIAPGETEWLSFTTGAVSNGQVAINGAALTNLGDVNGDSLPDFSAILVTGGEIGGAWGSFQGVPFFEVWNAQIRSVDNTPAVSLATCSIPGIVITTQDPVSNPIVTGAHGCSLSQTDSNFSEGATWGLILGFLAWLRGLMWMRKRYNRNKA